MELANSFWPRKLSAAPIGFSFQCETLFEAQVEHLILWLEVVHEEEAVGVPGRLLVDPVQLGAGRRQLSLTGGGGGPPDDPPDDEDEDDDDEGDEEDEEEEEEEDDRTEIER